MTPLFHSLLTAVGVTLGALLLGFMVALWAMGLGPSGRRWVLGTAVVALAMPPFLVTNCWLDVMGTNGAWHRWLPWNLFSLGGAVWLLTLLNWPLATLAAVAAWARLESSALEIEPRMRGVSLIRHLLWPLAAPGLGWAAALIFVLALNNFAVPAILQVKVLPAEMWVGFNTNLDAWAAVRVGWPLLAAPFLLVLLWRPREIAWPRLGGGVSGELFRRQLGSGWTGLVAGVGVIVVLLSVALPLGQLVGARRTWIELFPALQAGLEVAWNSAWYAVATATLTVGIGCWVMARWTNHGSFPLTPALSLRERENQTPTRANVGAVGTVGVRASCLPLPRGEGRGEGEATKTSTTTTTSFKRYQSRKVGPSSAHGAHPAPTLTSLLWIPFFIPGLFLGLALIAIFNRPGLDIIYQGSGIILIAFVLRYLALGWFGALLAWRGLDRDLVDAGRMCGATGWPLWRQVLWPQLRSQLGAAWLVVYLLCLWDVETLVLILPPGGETLALRVFNLLHYGHNAQVNALCLWLLALALLPLLLWWIGSGWGGSTVPFPLTPAIRRSAPVPGRSNVRGTGGLGLDEAPSDLGTVLRPGTGALRNALIPAMLLYLVLLTASCTPPDGQLHSQVFSSVEIIGTRGAGPGQFNKPRSVAVDAQDNLYVVDMTGRVQKFTPDGRFVLAWQMPQTDLGKPKGMARDRQGHIIVIEPHYSRVNFFSTNGALVAQWGRKGTHAGFLTVPRAVAVNARGDLWLGEYSEAERLQRFTAQGQFLQEVGHPGSAPGEFNRPEGLGVDAQDRLYVADSCNHRIQVFGADGRFLRAYGRAGSGPGEFSYPYDVRVDELGRQYVCEFGNSRLQIFDAQDRLLEILGGPGAAPGRFSNPWSIAFDSKGNLYVADSQNHRVQKLIRRPRKNDPSRMTNDERMTNPQFPLAGGNSSLLHSVLDIHSSFVTRHSSFPISGA